VKLSIPPPKRGRGTYTAAPVVGFTVRVPFVGPATRANVTTSPFASAQSSARSIGRRWSCCAVIVGLAQTGGRWIRNSAIAS
jgi:hypothetical protein